MSYQSSPFTSTDPLDLNSPFSHSMLLACILLQTADKDDNTTQLEPLPNLDYHLLNTLIHLARPYLSKHDIKRFDYLVDARKLYYQCHYKFQSAFRILVDLSAQSDMLDTRHASLNQSLILVQSQPPTNEQINAATTLMEELKNLEVVRRINERETRTALADLKKRREKLQRACRWFSSLKWKYLNTEVQTLVEIGKQVYACMNGTRLDSPKVGPMPDASDSLLTAGDSLLEGEMGACDGVKERERGF